MTDHSDEEERRVYYQGSFGGWTDRNPGMLSTGARLHLALGDAVPAAPSGALTHASFFSGAGGLDLGLEHAGWSTVSVSEVDPYACAVLAARWPDVPNLGDIVELARDPEGARSDDWQRATLWSGGFPCQDLSVAGKRRGMGAGTRSGLAFAFLDLVERYRPPALLLENVPGLLSSHRGRDMAVLLGRVVELGYGVAFRTLDARHFGVPQRRHRVFIVGVRGDALDPDLDLAADRAASVLAVGAFCDRHPPQGSEAGQEATRRARSGAGIHGSAADGAAYTRTIAANTGHHGYALGTQDFDGGYLQAVDVAAPVVSGSQSGGFRTEPGDHLVVGALPASLGRGLGHNKDEFVVAAAVGEGDSRRDGSDAADERERDGRSSRRAAGRAGAPDDAGGNGSRRVGQDGGQGTADSTRPVGDARHGGIGDAVRREGGPASDAGRVREADGLAGRLDDSPGLDAATGFVQRGREEGARLEAFGEVAPAIRTPGGGSSHVFVKMHHAEDVDDGETWEGAKDVVPTLAAVTNGPTTRIVGRMAEDPLLPKGLDSHRYRCCGNGVVAPVAEWLGGRLRLLVEEEL